MSVSPRARIVKWNLGTTVQGREMIAYAFAPEGQMSPEKPAQAPWRWFLLIAGVHGDEIEGLWVARQMMESLLEEHPYEHIGVVVWPEANPDGTAAGMRYNANGVDLNRNLPTKDWTPEIKNPRYPPGPAAASEPESRAMVALIEAIHPVAIISAHSFSKPQVNANGPSLEWATGVAALCQYPVTQDMGYPSPGCLGTYAGAERGIPTITLEILRGQDENTVLGLHTMTVATAIAHWDRAGGP